MSNQEQGSEERQLRAGTPCDGVEVLEPRAVPLGGLRAMTVYRTLPQRQRSLVGAWCFLDHYGPDLVAASGGMVVPRHPHTGLATVSWLFTGSINHLDSAGNAATVRPGELNLMIAGRGITHQEISAPETEVLHGVQLWYALPEATRASENDFVRYTPAPVQLPGATVRVFIGSLLGAASPVNTRTPGLLGAEILLAPGASLSLELDVNFEHAVLAENGQVVLNDTVVEHRELGYVPPATTTLTLSAPDGSPAPDADGFVGTRVMLLGGEPLGEDIVMWWNFIGRTHEEILEYRRRYQAEMGFETPDPNDADKRPLFGDFPPGERAALPAPAAPKARLRPRS